MRRILTLAALIAFSSGTLVGSPAEAAEPTCEYARVDSYWVSYCAPILFNASECKTLAITGQPPEVVVDLCYPTEI